MSDEAETKTETEAETEAGSESESESETGTAAETGTETVEKADASKKRTSWLEPETRKRRLLLAVGVYLVVSIVMAAVAGPERIGQHTSYNHYAQLADAWLHGHQDLYKGPAPYSQMNDFGRFDGKWYITFPPFVAILMLPFVWLAGSPENFRDGQFMVWLAGIAPAVLFLVLEKLRRRGISLRSERENVFLALLFAFGTVYFFTAVEGTTWFAHHIVAAALLAIYLLYAIDAEKPWLCGLMIGFIFLTRPHVLLTSAFFALEAIRVSCKDGMETAGPWLQRVERTWARVDKAAFFRRILEFSLPVAACLAFASWMNYERFHRLSPAAFGHEYLTVAWQGRMARWGVFGYHYLAKNLGVAFTILPFLPPKGSPAEAPMLQINEHGLALWFVSPIYLWLLWPKRTGWTHTLAWIAAAGPIAMDLLYQNSGWRQFSYRFSNDYSVLLFVALAVGGRRISGLFKAAAAWSVAWNLFGAVTFDRMDFDKYYWREPTQKVLYQDD
ncbi:MAG TPA: hypothetical protein VLM85_32740 [Polyangiaceae bacterium]|nr:hypothetical protein [Polyangiaceae bacterium]